MLLEGQSKDVQVKLRVQFEVFYSAQYNYILPYEKDSYVNIGRLRFIYTTKTLISSMG